MRLDGKVALVTGAAMGMGEAFAKRLAHEGCIVIAADVAAAHGEAVAEQIRKTGRKAEFRHLNVTDISGWSDTIAYVRSRFDRLDVLVNNAGVASAGSVTDCPLDEWNRIIAVNLTGVFLGCKTSIPLMAHGGSGSIINISSIWGNASDQLAAAYSASKGGVRSLTKSAALHCAATNSGVRVNSIHPGFVATPMVEGGVGSMPEDVAAAYEARTVGRVPMGRIGTPQDIEGAVVFLASDDSAFMTGSELVVDGGMLCH